MSNVASSHPESRRHTKDSDRNRRVPSLRVHKASGQTYVVLSGKAVVSSRNSPFRHTPLFPLSVHQRRAANGNNTIGGRTCEALYILPRGNVRNDKGNRGT